LAELVQIGLNVARMVGRIAEAGTELAEAASQARVAEGVSPLASSLAEAIEADRAAAAAAAEARQTVVARAEAVTAAFARVSRAVRLTVLLAERLDRGWARGREADDRPAMARRQIARGVADAIGRKAESERAARLTGALAERLEALDTEAGIGNRSVEEIIGAICRDLGLDPVRMTVRSPLPDAISLVETGKTAPLAGGGRGWEARPPQRGRTGEAGRARAPNARSFGRRREDNRPLVGSRAKPLPKPQLSVAQNVPYAG
jgi:hypothetical protein